MIANPFDDFVSAEQAVLRRDSTGNDKVGHLLWGDGVHVTGPAANGRLPVRARGRNRRGWVDVADLGGRPLLEVYFIDVGQGDGMLIRTPDFRHVMIDGGHPRRSQPSGKNAADFVDWKFFEDYGLDRIDLDAMIISHNDFDHYGGLADILDAAQEEELDCQGVTVDAFYHAGVSWWREGQSGKTLGPTASSGGDTFLIRLLEDRASLLLALDETSGGPQLQGEWRRFLEKVRDARTAAGGSTPVRRLTDRSATVPGFDDGAMGVLRVLAPVHFQIGGQAAVRRYPGGDSKNTNGNSILLRLDFGAVRILLTGDLNKASQSALLQDYEGRRLEFKCDVAKGCHHGSDDVSFGFLQAMEPAATIISSGDGEGHDHPRPRIVAASGVTGHLTVEDDEIRTPLVYSTELARSYQLGDPLAIHMPGDATTAAITVDGARLDRTEVDLAVRKPGGLRAERKKRSLGRSYVVAGLSYGLVNLRTDGRKILLATMNEGDGSWSVRSFRSRF